MVTKRIESPPTYTCPYHMWTCVIFSSLKNASNWPSQSSDQRNILQNVGFTIHHPKKIGGIMIPLMRNVHFLPRMPLCSPVSPNAPCYLVRQTHCPESSLKNIELFFSLFLLFWMLARAQVCFLWYVWFLHDLPLCSPSNQMRPCLPHGRPQRL